MCPSGFSFSKLLTHNTGAIILDPVLWSCTHVIVQRNGHNALKNICLDNLDVKIYDADAIIPFIACGLSSVKLSAPCVITII